jgi:uncharacterized membrane protein YqaE (UPF0057 family)
MQFIRLLFAFLIPPAAVYMQFGVGRHFAVNLLLTLLGFVPGVVHAILIMAANRPGPVKQENMPESAQQASARNTHAA